MTESMKSNRDKLWFIAVNAVIFGIMFAINIVYPLCWDDYGFIRHFADGNWSIKDIIVDSYRTYYLEWSGKIVSLSLATLFTLMDKMVYNIVNSAMYIVFANVIHFFFRRKKYDYKMLAAIYAALWIFIPWFGTVILWIDGTVEYMWMLIPILILGLIYYRTYFGYSAKKRSVIGIFLLGLLAGCALEATGSALIFALGIMVIFKILRKNAFRPWEISGIIGTLAGFGVLMLAPGNYGRADVVLGTADRYSNIVFRVGRVCLFFVIYLGPLMAVTIALILALYFSKKDKDRRKLICLIQDIYETCKEPIVFVIIAIVSILVMFFSPAFAARVFLTPVVLLIIACGISIKGLCEEKASFEIIVKYQSVINVFLVIICTFVVVEMLLAFVCCYYSGEPITKNVQYTNLLNDIRLFNE